MKKIIIALIAIAIIIFVVRSTTSKQEIAPDEDTTVFEFTHANLELADVTEGEVRGVTTTEETSGFALAGYNDGVYRLEAAFGGLPEPQGDDFYEGWIVRRGGDFSVISTGKLVLEGEGMYSNSYSSEVNNLDHDFYVLTLEPNDGDPAPADHILEGVLEIGV